MRKLSGTAAPSEGCSRLTLPRSAWFPRCRFQPECAGGLLDPVGATERGAAVAAVAERGEFSFGLDLVDALDPRVGQRNRPVGEERQVIGRLVGPDPETTPRPLFGSFDQPRAERIPLDIAERAVEVLFCFDWKGLEAALVDMPQTDAVVVLLPAGGVGDCQPLHERRELFALLGPEHKVPMIGHQAISEDADWRFVERLAEDSLEGGVVVFVVKEGLLVHAPVQDMKRHSGRRGASVSGHVQKYTKFSKRENWTCPRFIRGHLSESRSLFADVPIKDVKRHSKCGPKNWT